MSINRRGFVLSGLLAAGAALVGAFIGRAVPGARPKPVSALAPIEQPATPGREAFMARAFDMRREAVERGDQAFGAIVVKDGQIVGLGPSRVVTNSDPTAHAEMEAVRDAAQRLGTRDLSSCELYASSRPCRMCESAAYWANVSRIYFGADIADAGAPKINC